MCGVGRLLARPRIGAQFTLRAAGVSCVLRDVLKSNARAGPAVTRQGSAIPRSLTLSNKKLSEAGALAPASLYKGSARPSH